MDARGRQAGMTGVIGRSLADLAALMEAAEIRAIGNDAEPEGRPAVDVSSRAGAADAFPSGVREAPLRDRRALPVGAGVGPSGDAGVVGIASVVASVVAVMGHARTSRVVCAWSRTVALSGERPPGWSSTYRRRNIGVITGRIAGTNV